MIRLTISLCVLLGAGVLSSPLPKAQEDGLPQDLIHDFLIQQAFSPEKEASPIFDAHDVLRFADENKPEEPKESIFLPQEHQVEAGISVAEEPQQHETGPLHGRLLSRGRSSNRRFPNRQNRIPPQEEPLVLEEEIDAPQEEELPIEVEPKEQVSPIRRGSRFPLRSRPNPLARGRNRARPSKKPTTQATTTPQPETEPPVEEAIQDQDYHYDDYGDEAPTTTPKPRGILARRRNFSRNTNALFEALRKRRKQYAKTTTTTTPRPAPRENYEKDVPSAAEDSKATGRKSVPSRRFGNSRGNRRRFSPRQRKPERQSEPQANEAEFDEAGVNEQPQEVRGHRSFKTRFSGRQS